MRNRLSELENRINMYFKILLYSIPFIIIYYIMSSIDDGLASMGDGIATIVCILIICLIVVLLAVYIVMVFSDEKYIIAPELIENNVELSRSENEALFLKIEKSLNKIFDIDITIKGLRFFQYCSKEDFSSIQYTPTLEIENNNDLSLTVIDDGKKLKVTFNQAKELKRTSSGLYVVESVDESDRVFVISSK